MPGEERVACVGLGSNVGARRHHLQRALRSLAASPGVRLVALSSLFETAPVGGPAQGAYLNAAARVESTLDAFALLDRLHEIEALGGRSRGVLRDTPRTIDLDLLLFGDLVIEEARLVVPHPRMHERAFVLAPLAEIAGEMRHPRLDRKVGELLDELPEDRGVRRLAAPLFASTDGLIR